MNFGELEDMQEMAFERLEKIKLEYPDAQLLDPDDVRVIFLTAFASDNYHKYATSFDSQNWKLKKRSY